MLKVTEFAFNCCAVTDKARTRKFYKSVLGSKRSSVVDLPDGNTICIHKRKAG